MSTTVRRILIVGSIFGVFMWLFVQQPTADGQQGVVTLFFLLAAYFLPWIVALTRGHHNAAAICVLNIFLGWTLLGWVIALVWACTAVLHPENNDLVLRNEVTQ